MAKKQKVKVVVLKIQGEKLQKEVKSFRLPDPQNPWWSITLEDGNEIYATGDVSLEVVKTGPNITRTHLNEFVNQLRAERDLID